MSDEVVGATSLEVRYSAPSVLRSHENRESGPDSLSEDARALFNSLFEARQAFWEKLLSFPLVQESWISTLTRVACGELSLKRYVLHHRETSRETIAEVLASVRPLVAQLNHVECANERDLLRRQIAAQVVKIPILPESALASATKVIRQSELLARRESELQRHGPAVQPGGTALSEIAAEARALREALGGDASRTRERVLEMTQVQDVYQRAREALLERYAPLASAYARRVFVVGGDTSDIEQAARIGLLKAIERVSFQSNIPFKVFTHVGMRLEVIQELCFQAGLVRVPEAHLKPLKEMRKLTASAEGDRFLRVDEIGEQMGVSPEVMVALGPMLQPVQRIVLGDERDFIEPSAPQPYGGVLAGLEVAEAKQKLMEALEKLPDDERQAVSLRFGLSDGIERSFPRISKIMDRSLGTAFGKFNVGLGRLRRILSEGR